MVHIQSECGKMRTRITPNTDTFHGLLYKQCLFKSLERWYRIQNKIEEKHRTQKDQKLFSERISRTYRLISTRIEQINDHPWKTHKIQLQRSFFKPWDHETKTILNKLCSYLWQWKLFKNDEKHFLFHVKALFILTIFTFLSWVFGYVEKRFDNKAMVNFKIYDIADWITNDYNTHIDQYLKK